MGRRKVEHIRLHEDVFKENEWKRSWTETISINSYRIYTTLSGQRWDSLIKRCDSVGTEQTKYPRYVGTVNDFSGFAEFVEWSRCEVGYGLREQVGGKSWAWSLDKDLLGFDAKCYSEDTCIFVPIHINTFLTARNSERGCYPVGVSWKEKNNKFQARVRGGGKSIYLGLHETPEEAHRAWQAGKIRVGRELAEPYKGWHNKLYAGLNLWLDRIQEDFENYRETKL